MLHTTKIQSLTSLTKFYYPDKMEAIKKEVRSQMSSKDSGPPLWSWTFLAGAAVGLVFMLLIVTVRPPGEGEAKGGDLPMGKHVVYDWIDSDSWRGVDMPFALLALDNESVNPEDFRWHMLPSDIDIRGEPCESRADALCFMKVYQEKGGKVYEFLPQTSEDP